MSHTKMNPMSCNTMNFFQYYGQSKKVENKAVEYDMCWFYNKNCYSYTQALQILKGMKNSHTRTHNKVLLRMYKCPKCSSWHLTSDFKTRDGYKKLSYTA